MNHGTTLKPAFIGSIINFWVSPQKPILIISSGFIDSYIIFNDNSFLTNDDDTKTLKQDQDFNEQAAAPEIKLIQSSDKTVLKDKLNEELELQLTIPDRKEVIKSPLEQDILWFLEFDGSVNKLGAGAGVWIHNKKTAMQRAEPID